MISRDYLVSDVVETLERAEEAQQRELATLVECGLTPVEALRAATLVPATFLERLSDFGTVQTRKKADLVFLNANPLKDIRNTKALWAVMTDGKLYQRADLDNLLRASFGRAFRRDSRIAAGQN